MSGITWDEFLGAVNRLEAGGKSVTTLQVRAELGRGSNSTIQKMIARWKTEQPAAAETLEKRSDPPFRELFSAFETELTAAILAWRDEEVRRAVEAALRNVTAEAQAKPDSLPSVQLVEAYETLRADHEALREKYETARTDLGRAQGALEEAKGQLGQTFQRAESLEQRIQDLNDRIARERAEAATATARAAAEKARADELASRLGRAGEQGKLFG